MQRIISPATRPRAKAACAVLAALIGAIGLAGCASFDGIGSDKQIDDILAYLRTFQQ